MIAPRVAFGNVPQQPHLASAGAMTVPPAELADRDDEGGVDVESAGTDKASWDSWTGAILIPRIQSVLQRAITQVLWYYGAFVI